MNRFCSECGHKIEPEQVFCPECGTPQQHEKTREEKTPQQQAPTPTVRTPLSFKKKLSFILIALLVVGLAAGHQMIKANTSSQQKVNAFLQALYAGETDAALAEMTIPENVGKDEQGYQKFLVQQDLADFKDRMYKAASGVADDGITRIVLHENGLELFRIKESKFIGMYPGIQIEAIPVEVELATDIKGAQFELGDTIVETRNGDTKLGDFLPGTYNCRVSMENGMVEKELDQECEISGPQEMVLDISIKDMMAEIWSNNGDAVIYINGESTGKTVKENNLVGLIEQGETIDLFVERTNEKGELEKSEVVGVSGGSFVELPIFSTDSTGKDVSLQTGEDKKEEENAEAETSLTINEETLRVFISDFRSAYELALNQKDFTYIDGFLKDGSIAREELVEFIDDIGDEYYFYEFLVDEAMNIEILDEKAYVTTYEEFDFTNHLDVVTNYIRNKKYEIHLNGDGALQISRIDIMDTVRDN